MPACVEKKVLLSGEVHEYPCDLVHYTERFAVLRYVVDREYTVGSYAVRTGDITYAFYWIDRPYTLYTWQLKPTGRMLSYFNIADRISLSPHVITWRDLTVDILVDDKLQVQILDEQDLPRHLDPMLRRTIENVKSHILDHYPSILQEVNRILNGLAASS